MKNLIFVVFIIVMASQAALCQTKEKYSGIKTARDACKKANTLFQRSMIEEEIVLLFPVMCGKSYFITYPFVCFNADSAIRYTISNGAPKREAFLKEDLAWNQKYSVYTEKRALSLTKN